MKVIKRIILLSLMLISMGFVFRGWIYRSLVTYHSVGQRPNYPVTNQKLAAYLDVSTKDLNSLDIQQIIKKSLSVTGKQLNFTAAKNDVDPNELMTSKTAHCVGYATFFATACNYFINKYQPAGDWVAKPQIGQLYFLGVNVHAYFDSPFFKDHDFVTIENKTTGEIWAVDPSVDDYLKINFVSYQR